MSTYFERVSVIAPRGHTQVEIERALQVLHKSGHAVFTCFSFRDVRAIAPGLTNADAFSVIQKLESEYDASVGVNWDTLVNHIEELFPKTEIIPSEDANFSQDPSSEELRWLRQEFPELTADLDSASLRDVVENLNALGVGTNSRGWPHNVASEDLEAAIEVLNMEIEDAIECMRVK